MLHREVEEHDRECELDRAPHNEKTDMKFSKSGPMVNILNVKNKPFFSQYLCISFACSEYPPKMICH